MQGHELDEYRSTQAWLRNELRVHPREAAHLLGMAPAAPTVWGMVAIQGLLDPASGATVLAALNVLTSPPRDDDPRTAGQRRADALTELCRRASDGGELPQVNGEKLHLLVTVSYETLTGQLGAEPARLNWTGPIAALFRRC